MMEEDAARREDDTTTNQRQWHAIRIASIFGEKRPILCVTEKNTKKAIPISEWGLSESVSKLGSPEQVWGSFQFGDQHYIIQV